MRAAWMDAPATEYIEELAENEGDSYDDWIYTRMFPTATYQSRRDWWQDRFRAADENSKVHTYYRRYWEPHRSPATDHIYGPSYLSTCADEAVDRCDYWPWRTDGPTTLFKLFGLETADFRRPPGWSHLFEEK